MLWVLYQFFHALAKKLSFVPVFDALRLPAKRLKVSLINRQISILKQYEFFYNFINTFVAMHLEIVLIHGCYTAVQLQGLFFPIPWITGGWVSLLLKFWHFSKSCLEVVCNLFGHFFTLKGKLLIVFVAPKGNIWTRKLRFLAKI